MKLLLLVVAVVFCGSNFSYAGDASLDAPGAIDVCTQARIGTGVADRADPKPDERRIASERVVDSAARSAK
jgi:hypothetical protein